MSSITLIYFSEINPVFKHSLARSCQSEGFQTHESSNIETEVNALLEQIHNQSNQSNNDICVLISGTRFELDPLVHEVVSVLPIHLFPAFPTLLIQKSSNESAAFTQIYAGKINNMLFVAIPQQHELIMPLLNLLKLSKPLQNANMDLDNNPTVIGGNAPNISVNVSKEANAKEAATSTPIQINAEQNASADPPEPAAPVTKAGWKAALKMLHVSLDLAYAPLPEELFAIPAAYAVFEQAGERRFASDRYGNRFGVYGFPDLKRPTSKVLIIRPGSPYPEIIALHRHPFKVGLIPSQHSGYLIASQQSVEETCLQITNRKNKGDRIIAVESNMVYIQRDKDIIRWDGRRESDMGTIRQAIASLILQWSQR